MESVRSESVWPNPTEPDNRKPKNPTQQKPGTNSFALRAKMQPEMVICPAAFFFGFIICNDKMQLIAGIVRTKISSAR